MPTPGLPSGVTVLSVSGWQGEEEPEENPSKEEKQEPGTPMRKAGRPGRKRKHAQVSQRCQGQGVAVGVPPWGCPALWLQCWQSSAVGWPGCPVSQGAEPEQSWERPKGLSPPGPQNCPLTLAPSEPSCARWHYPAPCGSAGGPTVPLLPANGAAGPWEQSPPSL